MHGEFDFLQGNSTVILGTLVHDKLQVTDLGVAVLKKMFSCAHAKKRAKTC